MMKHLRVALTAVTAAVLCLGGTVWAVCPSADLSGDCQVDMKDFTLLAGQWIAVYDFGDLDAMASQWLTEGIPGDPGVMLWVHINEPGFNGYMSKYETTNAQYCQYLNAAKATGDIIVSTNYVKGTNGSNSGEDFLDTYYYNLAETGYGSAARINYNVSSGIFTVDAGFENHPVNCVSWWGATAFCNYYGWRLPAKGQWQAVADYDGSYTYGCGSTINTSLANYDLSSHPYGTTPVGAFGMYGYGMCDMAGNVQEWTSTITPLGSIVLHGGCFHIASSYCTVSSELTYNAGYMYSFFGFRVCR